MTTKFETALARLRTVCQQHPYIMRVDDVTPQGISINLHCTQAVDDFHSDVICIVKGNLERDRISGFELLFLNEQLGLNHQGKAILTPPLKPIATASHGQSVVQAIARLHPHPHQGEMLGGFVAASYAAMAELMQQRR